MSYDYVNSGHGLDVETLSKIVKISPQTFRVKLKRYHIEPTGNDVRLPSNNHSGKYSVSLYDAVCMLKYFICDKFEKQSGMPANRCDSIGKFIGGLDPADKQLYNTDCMLFVEVDYEYNMGKVTLWNSIYGGDIDYETYNMIILMEYSDCIEKYKQIKVTMNEYYNMTKAVDNER